MEIRRVEADEVGRVIAASVLFDDVATPEWTERFLGAPDHHLLLARVEGTDVGFVSGVETTHPDKGTEMFLYELGVDDAHRGQGIGRALVEALADLARQRGCYGMWVATESDNAAAIATYQAAGAGTPEPGVTLVWTFE